MTDLTRTQLLHTSALDPAALSAIRALLDDAFEGDFGDADWDHTIGGTHALIWEDGVLIAHGAVIQRRLVHQGRALRTGYVEGVAVRADRRRQGYGAAVMEALDRVVRGAYELGALSAADEAGAFYQALGWQLWRGTTSALTPTGIERTPEEDGSTYVLPLGAPLEMTGELTCDWRDGDVW